MLILKIKDCNTVLIEKLQEYQCYHQVNLINLTGGKLLTSDQSRVIEQAKFNYSPIEKALENQTKAIQNQGKITN